MPALTRTASAKRTTLNGKVIAITGAGSGIGRALALRLAAEGAALALSDVNLASVKAVAAEAASLGTIARAYQLDVTDRAAFAAHAEEVRADFGVVNGIVNNAGVYLLSTVRDMTWEEWDWVVNINLHGVANGVKAFLPHIIESGDGHIVTLSSVAGLSGFPKHSGYNASKFAVRGFSESLRTEMVSARLPVAVTTVHPGYVRTNIVEASRGSSRGGIETLFNALPKVSAELTASIVVRGMRKGKARVVIGLDGWLIHLGTRLIGARFLGIVAALDRLFLDKLEAKARTS